jgi:cytochrome c peroxidase
MTVRRGTHGSARAWRLASLGIALLLASACDRKYAISDPPPVQTSTLDVQLRQQLTGWGVMPILPVPAQNAALVDLGRALFFDKILSGNRDVSCASCHDPLMHATDSRALAIGTGAVGSGATRTLGDGRQFTPRSAPSLINSGLRTFYLFWDGRVNEEGGPARFQTPAGAALPTGLNTLLAAQAMFPVTNRNEMRGNVGDVDRFGKANELARFGDAEFGAIWAATMQRLLAVNEYVAKFSAAYPTVPASALGFQHAANAIAAFETQAFTHTNSPFDRYLARDDRALTDQEKRGALLFFGKARCSSCHFGATLGGQSFASVGVPQLGPGTGKGAPLDLGRGDVVDQPFYKFAFRVPSLRNVELTAPYMHNGAFATLDAVVRHYNDVEHTLRNYDVSQLDPSLRASYHGDAATITALLATLDGRLRTPMNLSEDELRELVAFLKSLTDPAARNLSGVVPARVPSGLPVQE